MGWPTVVKQSFKAFGNSSDILRNLKLFREFANRQTKQFGTKKQTLTRKKKLLYEGIPKPVGSSVMSHGRMRSYAMIKALKSRGMKLQLSDYKRGVKPKKRAGVHGTKSGLKSLGRIPGSRPRKIYETKFERYDDAGAKILRAQKRLNELRYKQSGSFLN